MVLLWSASYASKRTFTYNFTNSEDSPVYNIENKVLNATNNCSLVKLPVPLSNNEKTKWSFFSRVPLPRTLSPTESSLKSRVPLLSVSKMVKRRSTSAGLLSSNFKPVNSCNTLPKSDLFRLLPECALRTSSNFSTENLEEESSLISTRALFSRGVTGT